MNPVPEISVVVATCNRAAILDETLSHLTDQDLGAEFMEVIVVDDASTDATRDTVRNHEREVPFTLKYLRNDENRGCGFTQNRGILEARGRIVLLIADDIFLAPGAVRYHLEAHRRNPQSEISVLGKVVQSPRLNQSLMLRTWDPFRFQDLGESSDLPYYMFWACNISFKLDFMRRYGMFRDHKGRAGYAAHEDVEVGYRLHQHGLRILYCPEALGYHHHVTTLEHEIKRAYSRGLNWDEFRRFVPAPEINVKYHVLRLGDWKDHLRALFGPRRKYLSSADRNPVLLFSRYLIYCVAFNRITVPWGWLPFLRAAEHHGTLATWVSRHHYRGVIFFHFLRGCREGRKLPVAVS